LNPSLPGFGGSDALPWEELSMGGFARRVIEMMDRLEIEKAVILGHSMGGAVAMQLAFSYPERVLGVIYRDGAGTPSWKERNGIIVKALAPILPDMAAALDLGAAAVLDFPDVIAGRLGSTLRALFPDFHRNVRSLGRTLPAAAMLFGSDLSGECYQVGNSSSIPLLAEWGLFDRITPSRTAQEFTEITGQEVVWVPGGHSWMLARPASQAWVLKFHEKGKEFIDQVESRIQSFDRQRITPAAIGQTNIRQLRRNI
ncbi:MAG: alpha/beta hydrolase, partial [Acidimicrobiales bacterium]|nr:alpha/beta hydrolase [Acidimicrobiales bacterium]